MAGATRGYNGVVALVSAYARLLDRLLVELHVEYGSPLFLNS